MFSNITNEINKITDKLAGSSVATAKSVAKAIRQLGEYVGTGGGSSEPLILEIKEVADLTSAELQEMIPDYNLVVETLASNSMSIETVLAGGTSGEIENNFCLIKNYDDANGCYTYNPFPSFVKYDDYSAALFKPYVTATIIKDSLEHEAVAFDPESVLFTAIINTD